MPSKSNATAAIMRNMVALDDKDEEEATTPPPASSSSILGNYAVKQIPFDLLEPNRFQVKLRPEGLDKIKITELAENIAANGFTSVILVRPHLDQPGRYEIGHGHRRLAALIQAAEIEDTNNKVKGWTKIPARIAEAATDAEWLDIAISENLSREDLTPLAIANSFEAIRSQSQSVSLADIARRVGRSKSWVQRYDSINGAPDFLIQMIKEKPDSLEHLFTLKGLANPVLQRQLAQQVQAGQLTLKELQEKVRANKPLSTKTSKSALPDADTTSKAKSATSRYLSQFEQTLYYFHRQLELSNYQITFDQQEKFEQLIRQATELLDMTRPHSL